MGNILETFYILFKSNADDVAKGNKKAEQSADKTEGALNAMGAASDEVGRKFLNLATQAAGAITAVLSVTSLISSTLANAKAADELRNVSEALGVNIEDLSAWDDAVASSGGQVGDFQNDVRGLTEDLTQLSTVGKSRLLPFFGALGVHVVDAHGKVRKVMDIFPQLADSFAKLSKQQALGFGQKLGLSQGTILLLQQGRRAVDEVIAKQKELGVVTEKEAKVAHEFNDQVNDTAHAFRTLSLETSLGTLPVLQEFFAMLQEIAQFLTRHKDLLVGTFVALGGAITGAAIAMGVLTSPIVIVTAAIAGLVLVLGFLYDDITGFFEGKDSVTGRLVAWGGQFSALRNTVYALGQTFKLLGTFISAAWDALKPLLFAIGNWTGNKLSDILGYDGGNVGKAQQQIAAASISPFAAQTSNSILTRNTNAPRTSSLSIGEVKVITQATDAEGLARDVGQHLGNQMAQTLNGMDDGVAY